MALVGAGIVSRRAIGSVVVVLALLAVAAELGFGVSASIIEWLGRDPTLTDRTLVWADVLALKDSPILGVGFESFWLGPRLEVLWAKWKWQPNQAHNGYIEAYLDLGAVGVALLLGLLISTFGKITRQVAMNQDGSILKLGLIAAIVLYNFTEATFKGVHLVWTVFYIIAVNYPGKPRPAAEAGDPAIVRRSVGTGVAGGQGELRPARLR